MSRARIYGVALRGQDNSTALRPVRQRKPPKSHGTRTPKDPPPKPREPDKGKPETPSKKDVDTSKIAETDTDTEWMPSEGEEFFTLDSVSTTDTAEI